MSEHTTIQCTHLELLRFNWKPSVIRLALVALADAGPVPRRVWVVRSGLPANHFAAALQEAQRLGVLVVELPAEGLRLLVQPVAFWKERPLTGAEEFARAWSGAAVQGRMALGTEMPSLSEALAVRTTPHPGPLLERGGEGGDNRIPVVVPDSGGESYRIPVPLLNVQRSASSEKILEALNVERSEEPGFREGWIEPETEAEAMAATRRLLGETEMRVWGGLWRNRWRSNPAGVRKVLNLVREDQTAGRLPRNGSTWGRYASWLWKRFVEEVKA